MPFLLPVIKRIRPHLCPFVAFLLFSGQLVQIDNSASISFEIVQEFLAQSVMFFLIPIENIVDVSI
jgi:hypothetical protein